MSFEVQMSVLSLHLVFYLPLGCPSSCKKGIVNFPYQDFAHLASFFSKGAYSAVTEHSAFDTLRLQIQQVNKIISTFC